MANPEIAELERQIADLTAKLNELRRQAPGRPVPNYRFATLSGEVTLLDLFAGRDKLLAIHNMGQGCRYCTLWADGFNGLLGHLEDAMAVVLLSKDAPAVQRDFANSRNWRFRLASHGGGDYIREQTVMKMPRQYARCRRLRAPRRSGAPQEQLRVRARRPLLRNVEPAGAGRHGGIRVDAPVPVLATPDAHGRWGRESSSNNRHQTVTFLSYSGHHPDDWAFD